MRPARVVLFEVDALQVAWYFLVCIACASHLSWHRAFHLHGRSVCFTTSPSIASRRRPVPLGSDTVRNRAKRLSRILPFPSFPPLEQRQG
eukprot:scaffold431_cov334-Pavlova_lutheri.AAC.18